MVTRSFSNWLSSLAKSHKRALRNHTPRFESLERRELLAADLGGNSLLEARSLGTLGATNVVVKDFISSTDPNDYYTFTSTGSRKVGVSISAMTADADLELINSDGERILLSQHAGTANESISTYLAAGTYFIRVMDTKGNTNYTLNLASLSLADNAGNDTDSARNLGTLGNATLAYNDYVGTLDNNDFYKFTINGYSAVGISLSGITADADLQLTSSDGTIIAAPAKVGTTAESYSSILAAGTYFVRINSVGSGNTNYRFAITTIAKTDLSGNSLVAARNLGNIAAGSAAWADFISDADSNDFYKFTLTNARKVALTLTGLAANADLQLLDSSGNAISASSLTGTADDTISTSLAAGTYYVLVSRTEGFSNYTLKMTNTVIADAAGNTTATARAIALSTKTQVFADTVAYFDTTDMYKFTLSTQSAISLTLSGLSANAQLKLLNSSGVAIATSDNSDNANETIAGLYTAGTYYIMVYNAAGGTTYSLAAALSTSGGIALNNNGSLTELDIQGSSLADTILVSQSGSTISVTVNDVTTTYDATNIAEIAVWGADGNDNITIDSSVTLNARIYGGGGADSLTNQTSGHGIIVAIGGGIDTLTGNGVDTSFWFDTTDTAATTADDVAAGRVHTVKTFYQPYTTNTKLTTYVPLDPLGQNLAEPTDSGSIIRLSNRSLWGTGPTEKDINQGGLGDCYYLSTIAGIAYSSPEKLMELAVDLGDGTYAVQYKRNGVTSYVRVDADFAASGSNTRFNHVNTSTGIWGNVLEKAYAYFRYGRNTYASMSGGWMNAVMNDFGIANTTTWTSPSTNVENLYNSVSTALAAGRVATLGTFSSVASGTPLIGSHAYTILSADKDGNGAITFTVRNPWGFDGVSNNSNLSDGVVTITAAQLLVSCSAVMWATA